MIDKTATIIINLTGETEETLLKSFDRSRRKNINRAKSYNLHIEKVEGTDEEWEIFYEIHKAVWFAGGIKPMPLKYLKQFSLFFLLFNEMVIGGAAVKETERNIALISVASKKDFDYTRPNDFLYYSLIMYAFKIGKELVDLGGYQLNARGHLAGVNEFKEKWGGVKVIFDIEGNCLYLLGRKAIRILPILNCIWQKIPKGSIENGSI